MANPLTIRIQAVLCADDDGTNAATITPSGFAQRVEAANTIYASVGITFVFDPAIDLIRVPSSKLNRDLTVLEPPDVGDDGWNDEPAVDEESHQRAREDFARTYSKKIVVYCRQLTELKETDSVWRLSPKPNNSSWSAWYVNVTQSGSALTVLAHELGHYLQIRHTFASVDTVEEAASEIKKRVADGTYSMDDGLLALDRDRAWVLDTPADCSPKIFADGGVTPCGSEGVTIKVDFGNGTKEYLLKPDQHNVMSYHGCTGAKTISFEQRRRVRDGLEIGMRQRLVSMRGTGREALTLKGTSAAGLIGRYDVVALRYGRVVTPVSDGNNKLKVIVWDVSETGEIERRGDALAGEVDGIRACAIGLGMLVTAVRTPSGLLKLIVWKVDGAGKVTRKGSATGDEVSEISICRVGIEQVATAARRTDGTLGVDLWQVTASGDVAHQAKGSGGEISYTPPTIGLYPVGWCGFATSVRDGNGKLATILWRWVAGIGPLVRKDKLTYTDTGTYLTACALDTELGVTAIRVADGTLTLHGQSFPTDAETAAARGTAKAGKVGSLAMCRVGVEHVITGVSLDGDEVKLIAWYVSASGHDIVRRDAATLPGVQHVRISQTGMHQFLVAARTSSQNLAMSTWDLRAPVSLQAGWDQTWKLQDPLAGPLRRIVVDAETEVGCEIEVLL